MMSPSRSWRWSMSKVGRGDSLRGSGESSRAPESQATTIQRKLLVVSHPHTRAFEGRRHGGRPGTLRRPPCCHRGRRREPRRNVVVEYVAELLPLARREGREIASLADEREDYATDDFVGRAKGN